MSEIYVVIGPPRSGTSLVAGILHLCGVPMFPSLAKAIYENSGDEWNPAGHFADADFHNLTSQFLTGLELPIPTWAPDESALSTIAALVAERSTVPKWGFKGLHAWIGAKVLAGPGYDVRLIRTSRPVDQSQASFTELTGEAFKDGAPAFVASVKTLADAFYDEFSGPKMTVDFAAIYDTTQATVDAIAAFAGVASSLDAVTFVNPDWRRFG